MQKPELILQSEKYNITNVDFDDKLHQYIFYAISSMAYKGATRVEVQDVDLFLKDSAGGALFKNRNGVSLLNDIRQLVNETSFDSHYDLFKKENLLRDLKSNGIDTSEFYETNPITQEQIKISNKYLELEIKDILEVVKMKVLGIEGKYLKNDASETINAYEGIIELLEELESNPDIGLPLQGDLFNTIVSGARRGAFYVRSASSGVGKTRMAIADACHLAFPLRYNDKTCKWEHIGYNEKVLIIVTEQTMREVQTMILAYLTNINESRIKKKSLLNKAERDILSQAVSLLENYQENLHIVRMPNPNIQVVKTVIRENVMLHDIQYVFYDYIFVGPSLLQEFQGFNLRNDEALLMFSTALKDLAVELDIFVMSSTQTNAKGDNPIGIRDESSIAGARSIINKADVGCIMTRVTPEEIKQLEDLINESNILEPNIVTDIYKNRAGEWTQVRIWSYFNAGTMWKKDLFLTNSRLEPVQNFSLNTLFFDVPIEEYGEMLERLNS